MTHNEQTTKTTKKIHTYIYYDNPNTGLQLEIICPRDAWNLITHVDAKLTIPFQ